MSEAGRETSGGQALLSEDSTGLETTDKWLAPNEAVSDDERASGEKAG